ncbi:MAG: oxidoreductase [Microbacteriaceae bacterium]|nr:oxidoreductase [Microbacteriaceae bacterium]
MSWRYGEGLALFPELVVTRVADVDLERAAELASRIGATATTPDALYDDPDVDIIVNLTPPSLHRDTIIRALDAGKSVYVEKPLATTREDAAAVLAAEARNPGLIGSAPDTFLGSAAQTARQAIDSGVIGTPFGASSFIVASRAETWHPDPTFLFTEGGGPVLDLGPYFITALVNLLGPIVSVSAEGRTPRPVVPVTAPDRRVESIDVTIPTHVVASLGFSGGEIASLTASSEVWDSNAPLLELYGTKGTLSLPHPVHFDGDVRVRRHGEEEWSVIPPVIARFAGPGKDQQLRGLGVQDLSNAIDGAELRVGSGLASHVLDAMLAIDESITAGHRVTLASTTARPVTRKN